MKTTSLPFSAPEPTRSSTPKRYARLLGGLIFGSLTLATFQAQSATCKPYVPTYYEDFSMPIIGPDISTIGEDITVGSILYSGSYNFAVSSDKRVGWSCKVEAADVPTTYETYVKADVIAMPSGGPTFFGDKAVYPTNVPGIGVAINIKSVSLDSWKYPDIWYQEPMALTYPATTGNYGYMGSVRVQLIKTGPIATAATQQVLSTSFPTVQLSVGAIAPAPFEQPFMTLSFSGVMTMHTKTCQLETTVIDVELGSHPRAEFTGVGSGTEWKDFDIILKNCPPFHGYSQDSAYEYSYVESSDRTLGNGKANNVSITFNSAHGTYNARTALLESGPDSAEGIGIEVARRGDYTYNVNLNGMTPYSISALTTNDGGTYVYPLRARYVQYDSNIKGGKANGAVVFTINYL